jgi:hypothetical protein
MKEGLHLDGKGLRLLMSIDQINRGLRDLERLDFADSERHERLTARRDRAMRRARIHCQQAGISWEKFQGVLEEGRSERKARADREGG